MADGGAILFRGQESPFSNFYPAPFLLDGEKWPTTEHYFQAAKFPGLAQAQKIQCAATPAVAKKLGGSRAAPLRADWETKRNDVMRAAVLAKFRQNPALAATLLATGNRDLVEHTGRDGYWGDGKNGTGKNMLGKILMETRAILSQEAAGEDEPVAKKHCLSGDSDSSATAGAVSAAAAAVAPIVSGSLVQVRSGDLLDAPEQYIAQQCNTVSKSAKGLSAAMFARFPHANVYNGAVKVVRKPGAISVHGDPGRLIINMFGQVKIGKPEPSGADSAVKRLAYFRSCLQAIAEIKGLQSIAFPNEIGCGLGGGNWRDYLAELEQFAAKSPGVRVVLYKL